MSVVVVKVGKSKITMGADSFVGFSYDSQLKDKDVKIFKQNGIVVGGVGYAMDISLLRIFSKTRKIARNDEEAVLEYIMEFIDWAKKKDKDYRNRTNFMIITGGKAFFVANNLYIKEIIDYRAMGAGQDYAQTALMLGKSAKKAIEVATELSIYCEKPVNIFEVDL